jgi:hypothetical protein
MNHIYPGNLSDTDVFLAISKAAEEQRLRAQSSETLIALATIRLLLARLGRQA